MVARAPPPGAQAHRSRRSADRVSRRARGGGPLQSLLSLRISGWIALRFLNDPATAFTHFAHVDDGSSDPVVLARAAYWRGRTAEAANQSDEMRVQYQTAAAYPTAYYGQLARARLGHSQIARLSPPQP